MHSQIKIIDAFSRGDIFGEISAPKHRTTVLSNVFIFKNKVYKIYKNDNKFYNENFRDISSKKNRFDFTKKDFAWNQNLNKSIYLELKGICLRGNKIKFVANDLADELVIVMRKFGERFLLSNLLSKNKLGENDFFEIGKQLGEAMKINPVLDSEEKLTDIMKLRIKDVKSWVSSTDNKIDSDIRKKIFEKLDRLFADYSQNLENNKDKGVCLDINLENLIFENKKLSIIDSYPPKDAWMIADFSTNFYRIGSSVYMLAGKRAFKILKKGYLSSGVYLNDQGEDFFLLYSTLIDWPYLYIIGKRDPNKTELARKIGNSIVKKYLK